MAKYIFVSCIINHSMNTSEMLKKFYVGYNATNFYV
jgi:hypothetical protein